MTEHYPQSETWIGFTEPREVIGHTRDGTPIYLIGGGADRTVRVRLEALIGQYRAGLQQAGAQTAAFGSQLTRTASQNKAAFTAMGVAGVVGGGLVLKGLKGAGDEAIAFESKLMRLQTQIGVSADEMRRMGRAALDLRGTGVGALELADAAFFIESAGLRGAQAIEVLESSAKAAAIGVGDTATVADLATSAMNAYGPAVLSASDATDVLVGTVREGKAPAEELAASMGRVLPIASAMGVTFDEVGAAVAGMTRTGTDAATSTTQLRAIMNSLLKPAEQSEEAMRGLGLSSQFLRDTIKREGLWAALQDLRSEIGNNDAALGQIFPNVRALNGFLDLMGSNVEENAEIFARMSDVAGSTAEGFEIWANSAEGAEARFSASMEAARITIGDRVEPVLTGLRNTGISVVETFMSLPGPLQTAAVATAGLAGSVGLLGGAALLVLPRIPAMIDGFRLLRGVASGTSLSLRGMRRGLGALAAVAVVGSIMKIAAAIEDLREEARRFAAERVGSDFIPTESVDDMRKKVREAAQEIRALRQLGSQGSGGRALFEDEAQNVDEALVRLRALRDTVAPAEQGVADFFKQFVGKSDVQRRAAELNELTSQIERLESAQTLAGDAIRGDLDLTSDRYSAFNTDQKFLIGSHIDLVHEAAESGRDAAHVVDLLSQGLVDSAEAYARAGTSAGVLAGQEILVADALNLVRSAAGDANVELSEADQLLLTVAESGIAAGEAFREELGESLLAIGDQLRGGIPLWGEYEGAAEMSVDAILESLDRFVADMESWANAVGRLSGQASEETIAALLEMPPAQQAALARLAEEAPAEFDRLIAEYDAAFTQIGEIAEGVFADVLPGLAGDSIDMMAKTIEANAQLLIDAGQSSTDALRIAMGISLAQLPPEVRAALEPVIREMVNLEGEAGDSGGRAGRALLESLAPEVAGAIDHINNLTSAILGIPDRTVTIHTQFTSSGNAAAGGQVQGTVGSPVFEHQGGLIMHAGGQIPLMHSGGLRGDEIIAILQRGEFVTNRDSTRRFLPLLESINRMHGGGMPEAIVAGGSTSSTSPAPASTGDPALRAEIAGLRRDLEKLTFDLKLDEQTFGRATSRALQRRQDSRT